MSFSRPALSVGLFLLLSCPAFSQKYLIGRIHRRSSEEVLPSVSIVNRTQHKTNISDLGGNYKIPAIKGDTIFFSSAGYMPDTVITSSWMFEERDGHQVYLNPKAQTLATVRVGEQSNYQLDSLKRKQEYAWLYPVHPRKLVGNETVPDGFGVVLSPIDYFSTKEKQRRRLRRRIETDEKEYYIDSRFPAAYVARRTGL
jgi:hypothetical protein